MVLELWLWSTTLTQLVLSTSFLLTQLVLHAQLEPKILSTLIRTKLKVYTRWPMCSTTQVALLSASIFLHPLALLMTSIQTDGITKSAMRWSCQLLKVAKLTCSFHNPGILINLLLIAQRKVLLLSSTGHLTLSVEETLRKTSCMFQTLSSVTEISILGELAVS